MKHKLQKIKEESQELCAEISSDLCTSKGHLEQIGDEYHRVTELSGQAAQVLDQIDLDFKAKTKLSKQDMVILFLATAIQCARQYLLTNDMLRITASEGDKLMEKTLDQVMPPSWKDVLFQGVPYDITTPSAHVSNAQLSGATHRYRTLGHDPVLGWIFGTANIMTNSLTKSDIITTYQVANQRIVRLYPLGTPAMMQRAANYALDDSMLLVAATARQAIHFGSDYFTKQGLPIPFLGTLSPETAHRFMNTNFKNPAHIDMWSITRGVALAALINELIAFIHRLFYNPSRDGAESLYEVRTRKILSYSGIMSTSSNAIIVAFTKDLSKLDVGGILVTLTRIVSDYKFIHEIKKDFLKNELYDRIIGTEYDFMKGEL